MQIHEGINIIEKEELGSHGETKVVWYCIPKTSICNQSLRYIKNLVDESIKEQNNQEYWNKLQLQFSEENLRKLQKQIDERKENDKKSNKILSPLM